MSSSKRKLKGRGCRNKGKVGERELAEFMRERGWAGARRGQQRSGLDQADVVDGPPGWHFECKRVEKLNAWRAFQQACRDAPVGDEPAVAARRNNGPWLTVCSLERLLALVREVEELRTKVEKLRWLLDNHGLFAPEQCRAYLKAQEEAEFERHVLEGVPGLESFLRNGGGG